MPLPRARGIACPETALLFELPAARSTVRLLPRSRWGKKGNDGAQGFFIFKENFSRPRSN